MSKLKFFLDENKEEKVEKAIKDFFKKNPKPSDDEVHEFAEEMGIDHHKFEEHIYRIFSKLINKEGEK